MRKYIAIIISLFISSLFFPSLSFAHAGEEHTTTEEYNASITQEPLSPFVGEKIKVSVTITDHHDKPVSNLHGNLVIKQLVQRQYLGKDTVHEEKEIYKEIATTDSFGSVGLEYTFNTEGTYDVEFVWGDDKETESTHLEIRAREPTSFFAPEEALERIWLFVGVALAGAVIGAIATFMLLTFSFHPKRRR